MHFAAMQLQLNQGAFNGTLNQKVIITFFDGELSIECLKLINKRAANKEIKRATEE